jgi:CubicO group peptidase (beta-lactamase class C family)
VLVVACALTAGPAAQSSNVAKVDAIFGRWNAATPGCAVAASKAGQVVVSRAYGLADLEHDVPNTPDTIFEAGSVSKQFTAAAVLLLARDGKLSLDDSVRKYVPEVPDYGVPLTIRHMLHHMSGLRDWGSVAAIGGWPRTTKAYTHDDVLEIVARQKALNFTPGTQYSYSNTGYNLAAIIVSRVSGQSFADFSRERIFAPLGMTHTSWRDDFRRVVKGRAIAYEERAGAKSGSELSDFSQDMPFENVYGNGGLLTTVGDLLLWNQNFVTPIVGDGAFVEMQQTPGVFNDGTPGSYAFGLTVGELRGVRQIDHSGSTAGYRAHLARYPDQGLSVAVLCNVSTGAATNYARAVADALLPGVFHAAPVSQASRPPAMPLRPSVAALGAMQGTYVSDEAQTILEAALDGETLTLRRRPATVIRLVPTVRSDEFQAGSLGTVTFRRDASGRVVGLSVSQARVFDLRFEKR